STRRYRSRRRHSVCDARRSTSLPPRRRRLARPALGIRAALSVRAWLLLGRLRCAGLRPPALGQEFHCSRDGNSHHFVLFVDPAVALEPLHFVPLELLEIAP